LKFVPKKKEIIKRIFWYQIASPWSISMHYSPKNKWCKLTTY